VEWVDSNRQAANRASKARTASAPTSSDEGSVRRTSTLPSEARKLAGPANVGAGVVGQPSGMFPAGQRFAGQQHFEMHSCPLPQANWLAAQAGAAGASGNLHWVSPSVNTYSNSSVLPSVALASSDGGLYRPTGIDGNSYSSSSRQLLLQQQQQQQLWWQTQHRGGVAAPSVPPLNRYNSNSSNLANLSPPAYSSTSLEGAIKAVCAAGYSSDICSEVGSYALSGGLLASPQSSGPSLAAAAAVAAAAASMDTGALDLALQQLQQQNIMLLQPMGNSMEEDRLSSECVLLPSLTTSLAMEERQRQALQLASSSATAVPAVYNTPNLTASGNPASTAIGFPQQQHSLGFQLPLSNSHLQQLLQQQEQQQQERQMAAQRQQWWAMQQTGPKTGTDEVVLALGLTCGQLAAVSQVLQELARISGAQAVLAGNEVGSVQLVLTGRPLEVQAAHSVANMMLAKIGVEEPLLPAVPGLPSVPRRSH